MSPSASSAARHEWRRLRRTHHATAVMATFALFGLLGPVLARYLPDIVSKAAADGMTITMPPATPADGFAQYLGNVSQLGLLVVCLVAVTGFNADGRRGVVIFYRLRQPSARRRLLPRWAALWSLASVAWVVGMVGAWYETVLLIGPVSVGRVVTATLTWLPYLALVVAVCALASTVVSSTSGAVGLAVGALLGLATLGMLPTVGDWLPAALVGAPTDIVRGTHGLGDFAPSVATALAATLAAGAAAVARVDRREW